MTIELDMEKLARAVRVKRGNRGLRAASEEIGCVSTSTLSRVENGSEPDMQSFIALCNWLDLSPGELFRSDEVVIKTRNTICAQIRADENLPIEIADALATLIEDVYARRRT